MTRASLGATHETRAFGFSPQRLSTIILSIPALGLTMSGEENMKPVNVDPRWCVLEARDSLEEPTGLTLDSIREALRTYLQPIKSDDPQLDFYTMYKRETMEYDTEYMAKYNEDLNTTLIFVCVSTSSLITT